MLHNCLTTLGGSLSAFLKGIPIATAWQHVMLLIYIDWIQVAWYTMVSRMKH